MKFVIYDDGDRALSINPASCWFTTLIERAEIVPPEGGGGEVSFFRGDPRVSLGSSLCQVVPMLFVLGVVLFR